MATVKKSEEEMLRRRAEKLLSKKIKAFPKIQDEDVKAPVHELQVHQIELEMQNEELRRAQEEIEKSRSKYVDLYDFAPVGYFTLNKKGQIVEVNLTGASLLGVERARLLKTPFSSFIMPEDQDFFWRFRRTSLGNPGRQSCELRLNRRASGPLWVALESMSIEAPDGNLIGIRLALMDVMERKRSEEALRESEKRLQDLYQTLGGPGIGAKSHCR